MDKEKIVAEILLIFGVAIWGCAFVFQKSGMDYLGPFSFSFIRCIIGSLFLAIISLVLYFIRKKKNIPSQNKSTKHLVKSGVIIGVVTAFAVALQQAGLVSESAGISGFITALYIIFVPFLGALFFHKKVNFIMIISILLAVIGLYFINVTDGGFNIENLWPGSVLLLGCAIAYAVQILLIEKYSPDCDPINLSAIQFFVAGVLQFPFIFIFKSTEIISLDRIIGALPALLFTGILSVGIAFTIQIYAQKKINSITASMIMSLESVFSIIFSLIITHDHYEVLQYIGCILIFIGVILTQIPFDKITKRVKNKLH